MMTPNYYAFFGLDEKFDIDLNELKRIFFQNSKRFHPDFHSMSDPEHQLEVLEKSALNNKAYNTLKEADSRAEHLLRIKGAWPEGDNASVSQAFLMEMMDFNEQLMELEFDPNATALSALSEQLESLELELNNDLKALQDQYDVVNETILLNKIKDLMLQKKYLLRIHEKIDKFAHQ